MLTPQARQALFSSPWLRGLSNDAREEAIGLFDEIGVPQGTVLFREGERADAIYLLATGSVDITVGERRLVRLPPGETFGMAYDAEQPRAATATAALDCRLLVLRRATWPRFNEIQPGLARELGRQLTRSLEIVLGHKQGGRCEYVLVGSAERWPAQRETIRAIADRLERELGAPVAVATVCSREAEASARPLRENGLDWVLAGDLSDLPGFRERATREVGERTAKVRFVLLDPHESVQHMDLGLTADVLVERVTGEKPPKPSRRGTRVIFLHDQRDGPGPSMAGGEIVALAAEEPERTRGFERLARQLCGHSVGLALGGGAAWGLAHIGVLEVLEEAGVPIDFIAGSSMGAIVGAHYALGYSPGELREMATRVKTLQDFVSIVPELLYLAADFNLVQPGFFAGQHFKKVLAAIAPITGKTFADLAIPFRAVATNIETGARAELLDGELADAVHASFAAPGILSPHRVGDGVYIDGGMVDPVPAETVRRMGADLVIAVNVVPPLDPDVRNPLDRILESLSRLNPLAALRDEEHRRLPGAFDAVMRTVQLMQYQLGNDRAGDADILINPELKEFWLLEFWAGESMIRKGVEATRDALPAIQEKLEAWRKASVPTEM
jgi:NTE family protein